MTSLWIRCSRKGSFLGFAMTLRERRLGLQELPDAGEAQQFLCGSDGVGRPRLFLFFIPIIYFRLRRSQKLRLLQVVEILADFAGCKPSPDCGVVARQRRAIPTGCRDELKRSHGRLR